MLSWSDERHALGVAEMDATHREFVAAVAGLHKAGLALADTRPGTIPPGLTVELRFPNCRLLAARYRRREKNVAA